MISKKFKANILLLITAIIWGFAFVAQRVGIKYIGSFTFNGVRFALGAISLVPLIWFNNKTSSQSKHSSKPLDTIKPGIIMGFMLFMGATLQQLGLEETTAGKAAFITGFYIILVPLFGFFLRQKINKRTWLAAIFAISGLYLISVTGGFSISKGDSLVFLSSFFWAGHILLMDKYTQNNSPLILSLVQYIVCSVLSLGLALSLEDISIKSLIQALIPLLYGGIGSVGIAYTLQAYGQKYANPAHATIILSLESVFAAIGEFLILGDAMNFKGYIGCALMFSSVLISQLESSHKQRTESVQTEAL